MSSKQTELVLLLRKYATLPCLVTPSTLPFSCVFLLQMQFVNVQIFLVIRV
jgi:hypothetical protein